VLFALKRHGTNIKVICECSIHCGWIQGKNSMAGGLAPATNLFVWGIFRKYERSDSAWFNVYKERMLFEEKYL